VELPDHTESQWALPIQNLGNTGSASDKWLKISAGESAAFNIKKDSFNRIGKRNGVMFLFVSFNKGGQYLQPVSFRRVGYRIKEVFHLLQRCFVIIFRFDRGNFIIVILTK
jgi:hypothetical protein